ncbi:hypothetical protein ACFQT0_14070 [Hymenobacter humi]|uniref:Uncharacterized protein n=1 Tax=Hymenobacter humi TaxID=1411620 RepID=A0ABW2U4G9_9BACT
MASFDQRALDPTQLILSSKQLTPMPSASAAKTSAVPQSFRQTDLRPWLVLVAGLLFALERLLARRREAQTLPSAL